MRVFHADSRSAAVLVPKNLLRAAMLETRWEHGTGERFRAPGKGRTPTD